MTEKDQLTKQQSGKVVDGAPVCNSLARDGRGGVFHTGILYSVGCVHFLAFVYCWLMCFGPLSRYAILNEKTLMSIYLLNIFCLFALSQLGDMRRGYSWARKIFIIFVLIELAFSLILIKEFNALPLRFCLVLAHELNYLFIYVLSIFIFCAGIVLYLLGGYSWCRVVSVVFAFFGAFISFLIVFRATTNALSIFFSFFISYLLLVAVYFLFHSVESRYSVEEGGTPVLSVPRPDRYWKYAVLGLLFFFLFHEEFRHLLDLWSNPQESHGLLIPAFSLYFLYQDRDRLKGVSGRSNYVGLLLILNCVCWYVFWLLNGFSYPRQLILVFTLGSVVLSVGGWRVLRWVWLPILFLLFAIPIPSRLHWEIAMPLRKLASIVASAILNGLPNVECSHEGVLIHGTHAVLVGGLTTLKEFSLNVAEACSGMRILRTFVALGVAMAYLEYRPWLHRLVLLASTIPIAVFCNVLRVLITGIFHIYFSHELSSGTPHMLLGMAMLIVAFGLYGLLAWIMNRVYVEEAEQTEDILVVHRGT